MVGRMGLLGRGQGAEGLMGTRCGVYNIPYYGLPCSLFSEAHYVCMTGFWGLANHEGIIDIAITVTY